MSWIVDKFLTLADRPRDKSFYEQLNWELLESEQRKIEKFISDNKKTGVVFLFTGGGDGSFVDRAIRFFVAKKHGLSTDLAFSHCGVIFWDEERQYCCYNHQTYPVFKKEYFYFRPITTAIVINNVVIRNYAKAMADKLYLNKNKYGIFQLLTMIVPILTKNWLPTPIKAGKVCSEAVMNMWYYAKNKKERQLNMIDPNEAFNIISKECEQKGVLYYIRHFDFRKK